MKKKKRNFIIKIFNLLLLGIISVTLLGSWTYDPQTDTITSDNLAYVNVSSSTNVDVADITQGTTYTITFDLSRQANINIRYNINNSYTNITLKWGVNSVNFTFTSEYTCKLNLNLHASGTTITNIMLVEGSTSQQFEPYGQTYINKDEYDAMETSRDAWRSSYENLVTIYNNLQASYRDLEEDYSSLQNDFSELNSSYNDLSSRYSTLEDEYDTLESSYNDLSSRYSTLVDEYDTLLEEKQELQTEYQQLLIQYNLINQNLNQSNTYKYFYNAEVYYFNDVTHTYNYYVNNILNANASGTIQNITQNSNRLRYMDLPTSIQNYITTQADTPNGTHGYILIKLNVPTKLGINVEYQYLASNFKTALYNNFWDSEFIYDFGNNPTSTIASLIIDNNNLTLQEEYQYLFIENIANRGGDIAFSNIYTDEYLQAYANGYNTAIQDIDTITYNYKEQIKDLNTRIVHLNQQINTLQEQVNHPLDLNMRNLIWYIAETPFTSFKTIWNVDFLGLNIASFVTGLFSIWIVIFIIRKIFK